MSMRAVRQSEVVMTAAMDFALACEHKDWLQVQQSRALVALGLRLINATADLAVNAAAVNIGSGRRILSDGVGGALHEAGHMCAGLTTLDPPRVAGTEPSNVALALRHHVERIHEVSNL